jgi:hypothetical protein
MLAAVLLGVAGAALYSPARPHLEPQRVALAPSPAPSSVEDAPRREPAPEDAPVVIIRPLPERAPPKPGQPASVENRLPPSATPTPGALPETAPSTPATEPTAPESAAPEVGSETTPAPQVDALPVERPRVEAPSSEPARTEPAPAGPELRRRVRRTVRAVPPRPSGRLSIYFDADSSTFDRGKNRAPLRVEVYVGGRKVMETDDPEKREFEVAELPEGIHEVSIVPHVGDAQPRPRRFRVEVDGNAETRVAAVLRRRDGEALVGKLRARD